MTYQGRSETEIREILPGVGGGSCEVGSGGDFGELIFFVRGEVGVEAAAGADVIVLGYPHPLYDDMLLRRKFFKICLFRWKSWLGISLSAWDRVCDLESTLRSRTYGKPGRSWGGTE